MITVADEAFALLMVLNEYHRWVHYLKYPKKNRKRKRHDDSTSDDSVSSVSSDSDNTPEAPKKLFNDPMSGDKEGWDRMGIKAFNELCRQVRVRRAEEQSKQWEVAYKNKGKLSDSDNSSVSSENSDFDYEATSFDDEILQHMDENELARINASFTFKAEIELPDTVQTEKV